MSNKFLIILAFLVLSSNIMSMEKPEEETRQKTIEDLPKELYGYMTQFLGDTVADTIKNIQSLAQVNKHFHDIINNNPELIGNVIKNKFERREILNSLKDAMVNYNANLLKYLFRLGLVSSKDKVPFYSQTAMDYAINVSDMAGKINPKGLKLIQALLKGGVDINEKLIYGFTPLYAAIAKHNLELFKFLLDQEANPLIANSNNITVVDYARDHIEYTGEGFLELLKEKGFIQNT